MAFQTQSPFLLRGLGIVALSWLWLASQLAGSHAAQPPGPAIAVSGEPFGVFVVEVPIPQGVAHEQLRVLIDDRDGRIFYPATAVRTIQVTDAPPALPGRLRPGGLIDRVRNAVRGENKRTVPVAITVAGLFRGSEILNVHLVGDIQQRVTIAVTADRNRPAHAEILAQWWRIYATQIQRAERSGDHPMLMHHYLASMLARRLNLPWPLPANASDSDQGTEEPPSKMVEPLGTLALLSGIEPLRDEILNETLTLPASETNANLPMPVAPRWQPTIMPPPPGDVSIEPIANRVPPECFYLRFGSFANYLWFQELSARNGGDLAQIVLVRGFNYETSTRMERMLNTRMNLVSKMFGDRLISDMAIIGRDLYVKEGASLGVIFSTTNRGLLMSSFENERRQSAAKIPGASLQTLAIEGKEVSFLSTPDNQIRSFLVADGDQVLLTSSRHIVERFLQVGAGAPSLASLDSFRWARVWMPVENQYSLFGYFSPEFFHGLVSPEYQIELRRRLEAIAHLEIAEVAARAAVAEGIAPEVPAMIESGLLPAWFEDRADSGRALQLENRWIDSSRGGRGSLLPIVDIAPGQISQAEAERYSKLSEFYETKWQQMDPMLVGLRRFQSETLNPSQRNEQGLETIQPETLGSQSLRSIQTATERIGIEAYAAPFDRSKFGWVGDLLAPAAPLAIATPGDDMLSLQLLMNGTSPLTAPRQPYHLFTGVKDMVPPAPGETKGLIKTIRALKAAPAYVGAYPGPGYLDQLPLGLGGGRPDSNGFSHSLLTGLWRWQGSGFSLLSFDRSILENTLALMAPIQVDDSAQVRFKARDFSGSKLGEWINAQWYERAARASHGNATLLDTVSQQLKVPSADALKVVETMLDVRLNCPLGGNFVFVPLDPGQAPGLSQGPASRLGTGQPSGRAPGQASGADIGWWVSSAWSGQRRMPDGTIGPPADYVAPWLEWFRGIELHLTQFSDRLAVVGTLDVQRLPPASASSRSAANGLPPGVDDSMALPALNFDLFQLPLKLFGGSEPAKPPTVERRKF